MYLYCDFGSESTFSTDFIEILQSGLSPAELEFFSSFKSLLHRIRKSVFDIQMVIIFVPEASNVPELLGSKHLLRDVPLIIVLNQGLNDAERDLHGLHPKLISRAEFGILEVYSVLKKFRVHRAQLSEAAKKSKGSMCTSRKQDLESLSVRQRSWLQERE